MKGYQYQGRLLVNLKGMQVHTFSAKCGTRPVGLKVTWILHSSFGCNCISFPPSTTFSRVFPTFLTKQMASMLSFISGSDLELGVISTENATGRTLRLTSLACLATTSLTCTAPKFKTLSSGLTNSIYKGEDNSAVHKKRTSTYYTGNVKNLNCCASAL